MRAHGMRAFATLYCVVGVVIGLVAGCGGGADELESRASVLAASSERTARSGVTVTEPNYFFPGTGYVTQPLDIYVPYDTTGLLVGEHSSVPVAYWAQTFIATGRSPATLTIAALNNLPGDVPPAPFRFKMLLVEAPGTAGLFIPGAILWESGPVSISEVQSPQYSEVTFKIRGVHLTVGSRYAWVLDAYSTRDGAADVGQLMANMGREVPPYTQGEAYWRIATGQGRDVDFASPWTEWPGDVTFLLRFAK